ncbi:MAG: hypothetical protein HFJ54_08485 [Clostridia bacterium]|nr:hypothetical protein [Clostridia bacterium]
MKKRQRKKSNQGYKQLMKENKEVNYYRNFGSLTDDSVVTDIYNKKFKNNQETIATKCEVRKMTNEEYEKYFGRK